MNIQYDAFVYSPDYHSEHIARPISSHIHITVLQTLMRLLRTAGTRMFTASAFDSMKAMSCASELPGGATRHPAAIYFRGIFVFMRSKFDCGRILPTPWVMDRSSGRSSRILGLYFFRIVVARAVGGWHS